MELSEKQKKIVESDASRIVVIAAPASGKAVSTDEVVYTVNGPKKIGKVKIGEEIYCEDGLLHKILGVYPQGKKKKFIVRLNDKTEIICSEDHLWTYQTRNQRSKQSKKWTTSSLKEIIENVPLFIKDGSKNTWTGGESSRRNVFLPMTEAVTFAERELPIEPYTFGALLGDGSFRHLIFSNEDKDILDRVSEGLQQINCELHYKNRCDYTIFQNSKQIVSTILKRLKLWNCKSENKFIPDIYKYSSINQRLELIKGLIDTDGYCAGSSYEITLKSKQLILDLKEILESLGLTAVYSEKKVGYTNNGTHHDCGIGYRLYIKTSKVFQKLHSSQRRESQWKPSRVYAFRTIDEIIQTDEETEMVCIKVDNESSLFLTSNFIVTHNTVVLVERLKWLLAHDELPQSIVCITFTNAAAEELQKRIGNISGLFIGTIHSYANKLLMQAGINTSKIRAEEEFDKLFELVKEHPECLQPVEWLLWDEVQDSTNEQYEFLLNVVKPNKFFLVADFRQAIYSFDGGDPNLIIDLSMAPGVTKYDLDENYRNAQKIHTFSQELILSAGWKYRDKSIAMRPEKGEVIKVDYSPTRIVKTIKEYVKDGQSEYRDWFILTRTNKELEEIYRVCQQNDLPCDSFQKDMQDRDKEFKKMMARNTVKVMTIHCAKGLENDNVVVIGARQYNLEEKCVSYVAATRARNLLVWTKRKTPKPAMRRKQQYDANQLILESFE